MNTQRENARRILEGENAHQPLKTLSSVKKTSITLLKPLQDKNRNALKDPNSNNNNNITTTSKGTNKILQKQVYVDKEVKVEEIEKTKYTQPDVEESIKTEFFNDNKTRYKAKEKQEEEEEFMAIVPILPIIVPKRIKQMVIDKHTKIGSKRSRANNDVEEGDQANAEKKQKYSNKILFKPNAPALNIEITKEAEILEVQQETRAKMAMLQTSESLKEHQLGDPMLVAEYSGEIFGYFFDAETRLMADPSYALNLQHEVNWNMRGVLIDWVIEIHHLFQLLPETLFLTVNIIDRFLSLRTVVLSKLQLVGITSLFIATKFEEISCPTIQDFLFMTDNAVKEDELIKAERFILQVLDFHLCYPNPVNFLRRVCTNESKSDIHTRILAKYFMEISCIDHRFIGIRPSKIAAASLWLSKKMLATGKWNSNLSRLAGYTPEELKPTVEAMLDFLAQPVAHDAFFKKWATVDLSKASIFVRDWINRYYINE
ncbi:cyclin-like protein [Thamnidium elegans]|nr:cyclin-like protein [Thamnidium elegans]